MGSRSLMGSSNARISQTNQSPGGTRDPSWGVRTMLFGMREGNPRGSRSLMGSSNRRCSTKAGSVDQARDPSWGVRTRSACRSMNGRSELAIPHGEFELESWRSLTAPRSARDPSWGVRTRSDRAIMVALDELAIPHGEFELRFGPQCQRVGQPRDPSWGVRTRTTPRASGPPMSSRSLMGSSNRGPRLSGATAG